MIIFGFHGANGNKWWSTLTDVYEIMYNHAKRMEATSILCIVKEMTFI